MWTGGFNKVHLQLCRVFFQLQLISVPVPSVILNHIQLWALYHVYQLSPDIINRLCCLCCCCCCFWSSNLLLGMRDSPPSACERPHGRGDKIIAMVTTGCQPSQGMLGESHTDANSFSITWKNSYVLTQSTEHIKCHKNRVKQAHNL